MGDAVEASLLVTKSTIDEFASLSGDNNPIHLDDDYAAETMFGGRIAHGMIAASVISAALADLPGDIIYLSQDFEFENPVRPGDNIVARVEVVEELGKDRIRVKTTASVDEKSVLSGEAVVLSVPHEDAD
ncbi:MaoC family dehydratase [Halogeometricum borinquense]|uniref:Acyl dehydratase n=3 Tax=Halogeometricum borinquense TaxID=60847 RepID=E4NTJ9_HALBP|nr:acyl dehydratase [Halogeometricum borinquense DSM 11551]ELY29598.1 acyl dehydratase [Halogeometricum borinquense DSM 11551]QIB76463.1 MaoC family dehydratase [Halogeometricum borinquense]QIQ77738.1 MaoC family dehydratase [Halogeometricum borinquense]RYJ15383.1 MaoC family dehydratase [Halogeometricum borinquense]